MKKNNSDKIDFGGYQEHDVQDLIYFSKLTPEQKLDYLEKLVKALVEITPPQAKENARKLKELGF